MLPGDSTRQIMDTGLQVPSDLSPKRGQRPLHHPNILRPGILRGATPQIVLSDLARTLKDVIRSGRTPAGTELHAGMQEFGSRLAEAEQAELTKTGLLLGLAHSSTRAFTSHALGGRMIFGPDWYSDASSPDLIQRAFAFHTYAHEQFHAHRKAPLNRIVSIEEGLAELYAEQMTNQQLGYMPPGTRIYLGAKERALELALLVGDGDPMKGMRFLLQSRSAPDLPQWLYDAGIKRGIPQTQLLTLVFRSEELQKFLARGGKLR